MKIIILLAALVSSVYASDIELTMYKVYHGDMMLLRLPNREVMVIDTGYASKPTKFLFPDLVAQGVTKIDYLVLTHNDVDHIGGAPEVLQHYPIREVWTTTFPRAQRTYARMVEAIKASGATERRYVGGDEFYIGEAKFTFFNPSSDKSASNDSALVFKLEYKEFSMLFTGDLQKTGQKRLHELYGSALRSVVYKVAHHGDYSYRPFIDDIAPRYSMCPCLWVVPGIFPSVANWAYLKKISEYHSVRGHTLRLESDGRNVQILE